MYEAFCSLDDPVLSHAGTLGFTLVLSPKIKELYCLKRVGEIFPSVSGLIAKTRSDPILVFKYNDIAKCK